jgi:hypothetical protein
MNVWFCTVPRKEYRLSESGMRKSSEANKESDCMMESTSPAGQSASVLVFENGRAAGVWIVPIGAVALAAVVMANSAVRSMPGSSGAVVACLLMASMFSIIASRRWIAEIDLRARTLRISRRSFGRWTKTSVHCSLDQCRRLGRIEYETDGHLSYGVYVELTDGTRHAIPLRDSTLQEAGRVASQISDLTAISRLDVRF